ncbi:copper resistance CopC family protein [Alkalicoccobacillus gibsonii]|uniref:copper resistance CopC family protein n=1 Tax=Alkalicoccobacillus gibsonii TaxID=79881 RepID=UPI003515B524
MKKKVVSLALLVGLLIGVSPSVTYAHSHFESSVPEEGQTVEEAVETIELSFDGGIEQASEVQVFTADGEEIETTAVTVNSPNIEVELSEPLANGDYRVAYNVLSADTHPVEGELTFSVEAEEAIVEEDTEDEATTEEEVTDTEESADTEEQDTNVADEQQEEDSEESSNSIIWIVGAVLVVGVILGALAGFRRKR